MARLQREHLETLLAAVDHGTLDAAARVLAITPSAVSQRIKSMEQQLGRVLL
ncbi:LysR family transcriptional regulator, partial [Mycobacteroides abscessus]|uniref:LysR family transcriptional regulator n=1 Tax=Mycobacteroides abscessus TaxID=36809 RepID=UPI001042577B